MIRSIVNMKNRRNTSQRFEVLQAAKQLYHPSADEVYNELKAKNKNIGRATVFRNMNLLAGEGVFLKVCFQGEPIRFDTNPRQHDHFVCRLCGKIVDLDSQTDCVDYESCYSEQGVFIEKKFVTYYGLCSSCHTQNLKENG